jgi:arylsulfatase A-like enzyme
MRFTLAKLARPAPLSWAATAVAVLWLVGRDALAGAGAVALFLLGGAAAAALAAWIVEALWVRLPAQRLPGRWPSALAGSSLAVAPPLFVVAVLGRSLLEPGLRWLGPTLLVVAVLSALGLRWGLRRAGLAELPRAAFCTQLAALELLVALLWMHRVEGTFLHMRPGTEALHAGLFFGTWLVSCALLIPWSLRLHARLAPLPGSALRSAACLAAGLAGLAAIEIDRRALVDLYPAVHVWLEVVGVLSLDAALAPLWASRLAAGEGGLAGRPRLVGGLALGGAAVLLLPAVGFVGLLFSTTVRDAGFRAELLDTPLGPVLIELAPKPRRSSRSHPLLRYDQLLDVPAPDNAWNIVLVSSDALRGDALDAPGAKRADRSPRITRFASERCGYFQQAYAPGSRTAIGMGALMLGRYSAYIDWQFAIWKNNKLYRPEQLSPEQLQALGDKFGYTTLPVTPEHGSLARRLRRAGFQTMAVPWDSFAAFFDKGQGFEGGFDVYPNLKRKRWKDPSSSAVVAYALEQIDRRSRSKGQGKARFFQWIHLFDTHTSEGDPQLYRRRVLDTDAAIGELLDGLDRRKLLDQTVFVLVSDHGEALGEHRAKKHGTSLHEEQVRVPLVLCVPGVAAQVFEQPVSTIDAVATLLVLAGASRAAIDGVNLLPLLQQARYPERRPVFTELHRYRSNEIKRTTDLRAVRIGDWKLIKDLLRGSSKLYDLRRDPGELRNQIGAQPAAADELGAVLDAFIAEGEREHPLVALEPGRR